MKWLLPLTENQAARLYWELSRRGAFCLGSKKPWPYSRLHEEEILTLALLQARYDPRLLEILVGWFREPRPLLHPIRFKESLRQNDALPTAAVVGEFVSGLSPPQEVSEFFRFLSAGLRPVPTQLFYRGLYPIAGVKMEEAIARPPWGFKKWGFLAADPPYHREVLGERHPYLFDQDSRLQILKEFAKGRGPFRLKDYLREVSFSLSRQQALKDLARLPGLKKTGRGKGTTYCAVIKRP